MTDMPIRPAEALTSSCTLACWVCGSSRVTHHKARGIDRPLQPEDLQISDHRYGLTLSLLKCRACGFIFAEARELDELVGLYTRLNDEGYEESIEPRILQMKWLMGRALRLFPTAESMLDIGAGMGLLVGEGRRSGLRAVGVEPSTAFVRLARERLDVELLNGTFPHPALAGEHFDLIFLVDVIEHVADPLALLASCEAALSSRGIIILVTPDVSSPAVRVLGDRWWHFRLAHVGYFDRRSIETASRRAGLQPDRFFRARWFFRVGYLALRLQRYLPIGWLNRLADRVAPLKWVYARTIPLNLFDSWVVILKSAKGTQE